MTKPKRPHLDRPRILEGLRTARETAVHIAAAATPRSALKACADTLIGLIDDMALLLTGDRRYFHGKGHSSP